MAKKSNNKRASGLSPSMQWAILIGIAALVLGWLVFNAVRTTADDGGEGIVAAQSFDLPNLQNDDDPTDRIRLADFAGTPTVVNFFASWCVACDEELPAFRDTALELAGDVDFIFVNSNESGNWKSMAERNEILQFPLAKDIQGEVGRRNGLYRDLGVAQGMPITAFYDAEGTLLDVSRAPFTKSQLESRLAELGFVS